MGKNSEKKWEKKDNCKCSKCRELEVNVEVELEVEVECKKEDRNEWIRKILEGLEGERVSLFTKGGIHTEGTVADVRKDFVILVTTTAPPGHGELVEVFSNADDTLLEVFRRAFVRLDDIVTFGRDLN